MLYLALTNIKGTERHHNDKISKEEYDHWRYTYPEVEVQRTRDALDELRISKIKD